MKLKNELAKNTILLSIGNIGTKFINLIMIPIYTVWLTPDEYGRFDLILSIVAFLVPIVSCQLEQVVFRFIFYDKSLKEKILDEAITLVTIGIIVLTILLLPIHKNINYYVYIWLIIVIQCYYQLFKEYLRGIGKLNLYTIINIANIIIIFVFNWIFVVYFKMGIKGLFLSYILSYALCSFYMIYKERVKFKLQMDTKMQKKMLNFSIPLIPNTIAFWIINLSDRFLITYYVGDYYNGLYAIACKIPTLITTVYSAFSLAWQQEAITLIKEKKYNVIQNIFNTLLSFLFAVMLCATSLLPFFYKYFIDARYYDSIILVPILLLGTIYLSVSQFVNGILVADMRTVSVGVSTIISAGVNIIMNVLLLHQYGVFIAALSTCISYFVMLFIRLIMVKKIITKQALMKIFFYTLLQIIYTILIKLDYIYLNVILFILCFALVYFLNRREITEFISKHLHK